MLVSSGNEDKETVSNQCRRNNAFKSLLYILVLKSLQLFKLLFDSMFYTSDIVIESMR